MFDEGITTIVGPNGSGKSNIADAIRWVLGEQSYSTLRGKRTIDMIFAGSQTRPRAGMAQATLTLDNTEQWLPIDFTEVEIGRRAFRSGENEYLLNGQKVRLKDITDLLATSGLAERTYTMIGQGLIDQALSLRADERRALFEEAAGINHYKIRRALTLRRLNETQHNLERVHDILAEIGPRISSLKRQATRARNYEQIQQDLRHLLRIWYGYKWDRARVDARQARKEAADAEKTWKDSRRSLLVQQQNMDDLQGQINSDQRRLSTLQEQRDESREALEDARRTAAIQAERLQAIDSQLGDIEAELPLLVEQQDNAEAALSQATAELADSEKVLQESRQRHRAFKDSFQSQAGEIRTWQQRVSAAESERSKVLTRLAQAEGQLSQLQQRLRENELALQADPGASVEKLQAEQERQTASLKVEKSHLEKLRRRRDALQQQRRSLIEELKQLRQEAKEQQRALRDQQERMARLETKVDLLGQLRQAEVPLDGEVSVVGSLASLIDVPQTHKRAIEGALASRMATLIVANRDSVWKLTAREKPQSLHVAALADLKGLEKRNIPNDPEVIGWAGDLVVHTQPQAKAAVELLLSPVLLVKTKEAAYRLALNLPAGTLAVAADGFVAHAGGLVEINGEDVATNIMSRESAWREAKETLEQATVDVARLETSVAEVQEEIQHGQESVDELQEDDRRLGREENELIQSLSAAQRRVDNVGQQITYLHRQKEREAKESHRLQEQMKQLESQIAVDRAQGVSLDSELSEAKARLEALPVAEAQQQEQSLQQRIQTTETIVAGRQAVVDSRRTTLRQVEQQLLRLRQRRESLTAQKKSLESADTVVSQQALHERHTAFETRIKPLQQRLVAFRDDLMTLQQKMSGLQRRAHEAETRYMQTQVRQTQQVSQIEALQERIHADLGLVALRYDEDQTGATPLPIREVVEQLPSVDELPADIEKSIREYRGQLQRMGGINPDAPTEYAEAQERFDFMTQQVDDLQQTEAHLRKVISELDELTSRAFAETVEKVDDVFGTTFTQLFGGGSARLVLTEPDDLTISGVDIIARLPNRREQGLGLLSGGERSLTASALIFSLLKVSPTPFCVMDEVDAALDEANINRFRDIVRELSLKTQFIIITHNRGTVQAAQTIYGVSMQPDSTSQVISIRPEEYVRQELL